MTILHPVIGISGKKRSGKDTFAEVLVKDFGYTRVAFADPMREMALALDPIVGEDDDFDAFYITFHETRLSEVVEAVGWERAKSHREVRRTLQRLGTEAGRKVLGTNVWVDAALRKVEAIAGPVVITDVRFPNEARAVEKLSQGHLIRIERDGLDTTDEHESETALDDYPFDVVVENNGTVEDLHVIAGWTALDVASIHQYVAA